MGHRDLPASLRRHDADIFSILSIYPKASNFPGRYPFKPDYQRNRERARASSESNQPGDTMQAQHRGEHPMMARLILVGMVAALGISVSTWSEIHLCMEAVHSWTATQLAAWDAPRRGDRDSIVLVPLTVARPPAFERIVADDRPSGAAYDLNRAAEGLDIPAPAAMTRRRSGQDVRQRPIVAPMRMGASALPASDTLEARLAVELLSEVGGRDHQAPIAESQFMNPRARPAILPARCRFTASLTTSRPVPRTIAFHIKDGESPGGSRAKIDLIEVFRGPESGIAWELNRFADRIEALGTDRTNLAVSKPVFDPIEPLEAERSPDTGVADALNRASEGFTLALSVQPRDPWPAPESASRDRSPRPVPASPGLSSPPGTPSEVAQAMRLTREAVHAWMNVMIRPSRLQLSSR
jgi:hypothetical protein